MSKHTDTEQPVDAPSRAECSADTLDECPRHRPGKRRAGRVLKHLPECMRLEGWGTCSCDAELGLPPGTRTTEAPRMTR